MVSDANNYLASLFGLTGKKAVVTGASSGFGRTIALALGRAGAEVLIVARRAERLEDLAAESSGMEGTLIPLAADLSSEKGLDQVAESVERTWGGLDILVANAGIGARTQLEETTFDDFQRVIGFNASAQAALANRLFRFLRQSGHGRIINVASVLGLGGGERKGMGAYTASKHALVGLTRSQAIDWAKHGITANALAPAYFPTEMTDDLLEHGPTLERILGKTPMGRPGKLDELIPAVLFLASPASGYVTGVVLPVDGGWTAW